MALYVTVECTPFWGRDYASYEREKVESKIDVDLGWRARIVLVCGYQDTEWRFK